MLFGRGSRKAIAATLLLVFFTNTFAPSLSYALTAGPTQPEATNFEPIDTTDMVNLQSGSFTYSIPLLEVPGPEGGYPLALAYHAGLQPNEDASWVGLGWSLNPGAIDRNVNGYPDDWYAPTATSHSFWAGGQTTTYSVGVSIGVANMATVGANLSFAHDTYRGFGVGIEADADFGIHLGTTLSMGLSASLGISPYGAASGTFGAGLSLSLSNHIKASMGMQVSTNFESVSVGFSAGVNYSLGNKPVTQQHRTGNLLEVSIGTGGTKPSLSVGGLSSSVSNANSGRVSTTSHGFHLDIPVLPGVNLSLGYSKQRYWTDEYAGITTWGSLNNLGNGDPTNGNRVWNGFAYDEYSLLESPTFENFIDYPDPTTVQGGSFPDFDQYNLQCQGLSGNIRPYYFQGWLANQNLLNGSTPLVTYYVPGLTPNNPVFRFENDFSNSYRQNEPGYSDPSMNLRAVTPPMDPSPVYGNNDGTTGYNGVNGLAGSRHVDLGPKIHPRHPLGYKTTDRHLDYGIEGFSITNESGVTYHFGLPAYSFNEENYQEKIDQSHGATGNRVTRQTQYVYTWYLTTITGPDFVDRNGDGIADDGDWGYWVDFEYGKWSNNYNWRNPSQGYNPDEDNEWQDVTMGTREVYYLNAIRTRSHVALFEKDIRMDGKGASPEIFNKTVVSGIGNAAYANTGVYNSNSSQSLKLSHIYLLNASDENFVTATSGNSAAYQPTAGRPYSCTDCELASDVLDKTDVDAVGRAALEAKAIRVIDFNTDYSLCANTANSFDINSPATLMGKLTLLNFATRGKGGANLTPPISFGYDLGAKAVSQSGVTLSASNFTTTNGNFNKGDLIMASSPSSMFCGVITDKVLSAGVYTYPLANNTYTGSPITATVSTTKNPPYNKDAYDSWQLYKSDYNLTAIAGNQNLGRMTTPISASGVDAWCLRTITPQLGNQINVGYESSQVGLSALSSPFPYIINSAGLDGGAYNAITFTLNTYGYPLASMVKMGDVGQIVAQIQYSQCDASCLYDYKVFTSNYTITAIDGNGTIHASLSATIPNFDDEGNNTVLPFSDIVTGNITGTLLQPYGGGIRVNNISITNSDGTINSTAYNYNDPNTGLSSGVTSYMPGILDPYDKNAIEGLPVGTAFEAAYKKVLYAKVNNLYSLSRELPAPGLVYQYVTVTNQIKNPDEASARTIEGSTLYQFEVFSPNMVGIVDATPRTGPINTSLGTMFSRNLALCRFTSAIGNLKRKVQFDANGKKLSETINHYLHEGIISLSLNAFFSQYKALLAQYNYQGYLQERFYEIKEVTNQAISSNNGVKATLNAREEYPCIQTGQTIINYVNGTQTSNSVLAFDFYSGSATKTLETDAYGNNMVVETLPAYRIYPAMGLKINNDNNKNMLSQVAETYSWTVTADPTHAKIGLISANVTTWSDNGNVIDANGVSYTQNNTLGVGPGDVWRQQSNYDWLPTALTQDNTTPVASFSDFNWTTPSSSNPTWKKISTVTLYDVYSKGLEATDLESNYVATHLNYGDQKVILTGGPANFYEMAYSGAEDANITQTANIFVNGGSGTVVSGAGVAHTGVKSLQLGVSGVKGFTYSVPTANLVAGRTYQASVWVKPVTGSSSTVGLYYDIDGTVKNSASSSTSTKNANGWTLVNLVINGTDIVSGHTLNVWCRNDNASVQAYADDFRFQPLSASTSAYVYDPFSGELSYILDNSNIYTQYIYDGAGRLIQIYKEKLSTGIYKTTQFDYNYSMTNNGNAAINTSFTKNNCPAFTTPSSVSVNIPQGTYTSFVSQADADARAHVYAQDYANVNGSCACAPVFTYNTGITSIINNMSVSGTTVNFTYVFGWPTGATSVNLGNISGSCAFPTGTRTVPINNGSSVINVVISSTGNVQLTLVSGPTPSGNVGLSRKYDINQNAFYSAVASGTYAKSCPAGQTGSSVTYTVAANTYSSLISQADANQQAQNDVTANGQNYANANGTCTVNCGFTWNGGFASTSANIGSSGTTGSFTLSFMPTSGTYTSGTLGTITGGCKPSATRVLMGVPDISHSGRTWNVTITSTGTVSVTLGSGTGQIFQSPPAVISGNYAL